MLWILFTGNIWLLVILYIFLADVYKQASSFVSRTPNIISTPAVFFAFCSGLLLTHMYSGMFVDISIAAAFLGLGAGVMFGSLYHRDAAMIGAASGFMSGIMAPMLGEISGRSPLILVVSHLIFFMFLLYFRFYDQK
ncbi:hypothetical protein D7Z54_27405 [Salibacterium salarium]|uniref:Uncharacterized protein n=1 Tax=Salibacterium salarium TaxID=284579 RepID=A0A3R9QGT6_9BACI|nr:hypothetical protein [Salibacterium salarium]RSL30219.1 hypothetical protein D7Z54_27405 [Salibacterium salarium]